MCIESACRPVEFKQYLGMSKQSEFVLHPADEHKHLLAECRRCSRLTVRSCKHRQILRLHSHTIYPAIYIAYLRQDDIIDTVSDHQPIADIVYILAGQTKMHILGYSLILTPKFTLDEILDSFNIVISRGDTVPSLSLNVLNNLSIIISDISDRHQT